MIYSLGDIQLDMKQHRAFFFCLQKKNKTMYLLKRFNTDTLVSVKLKRTIMSYLKYR